MVYLGPLDSMVSPEMLARELMVLSGSDAVLAAVANRTIAAWRDEAVKISQKLTERVVDGIGKSLQLKLEDTLINAYCEYYTVEEMTKLVNIFKDPLMVKFFNEADDHGLAARGKELGNETTAELLTAFTMAIFPNKLP